MCTSGSNRRHVCVLKWAREAPPPGGDCPGNYLPGLGPHHGGEGNDPINDPGWPAGAAAVFNTESCIAYWEGPFGGGQYHAECRGNAAVFNLVLEDFAKIQAKTKRLVIHDGEGASFWLNTNNAPEKKAAAVTDWTFVVWVPANWQRQAASSLSASVRRTSFRTRKSPRPDRWSTPAAGSSGRTSSFPRESKSSTNGSSCTASNRRTATFSKESTAADGGKPIAATVSIEEMESNPAGGYRYTEKTTATADATGRWVVKNCPPGRIRIVLRAEGPRRGSWATGR